jgi:2-hydroxychromene-2-carboxylate isomerase
MEPPIFYYDAWSIYAYLAAERIDDLIPDADWRPVLVFALQKMDGRTPWVLTDEREARMAEIDERAQRYGLPSISWPSSLPQDVVGLNRAATVAKREGREKEFSRAALRATYAHGQDATEPDTLRRLAEESGLDGEALLRQIKEQDVKDELRRTTDEAYAAGVVGVPTTVVSGQAYWGDDRLEEAAAAVGAAR